MSCVSWNLQSGGGGRGGWSWKIPPVQAQTGRAETCQPPQGTRGFSAPSPSLPWHQLGLLPSRKGNSFSVPAHRKAGRAAGGRASLGEAGGNCAALPPEQHADTHGTMKIKKLVDVSAVSSSPSPSRVVCSVPQSTATASRLPARPDSCSAPSKRTLSFPRLHLNALLLNPLPPHYSLTTFTWIVVKNFLIDYSLQTLAENYHTPYLAKIEVWGKSTFWNQAIVQWDTGEPEKTAFN